VEDLDYDGYHHRIASVGNGSVQVWKVNADRESHLISASLILIPCLDTLSALPSPPPSRPFLTRNVIFGDRGDHVMVLYLESHEMYVGP
jgi:hypothetical protein